MDITTQAIRNKLNQYRKVHAEMAAREHRAERDGRREEARIIRQQMDDTYSYIMELEKLL